MVRYHNLWVNVIMLKVFHKTFQHSFINVPFQ